MVFADGAKVCPDGMTEKADAVFSCTDECELDISAACEENGADTCGNKQLDEGEVCDGDQFADGAKVCPGGMVEKADAVFSCTKKCELDISDACETKVAVCDPSNLDNDGDADKDGIPNGIEKESVMALDPCNADTDGDTVPDGIEDLNHNGIYEPDKGDTDPTDAASFVDVKSGQYQVIEAGCKAEDILSGSDATFKYMSVAKLDGAAYTDEKADGFVVAFTDESKKVVGLFGSKGSEIISTPDQLVGKALNVGTFVADSTFKSTVPMEIWSEGNYKKEYQVVPDHTVDRVKYTITLGDGQKTLEEARDKLVGLFGNVSGGKTTKTNCSGNKAILYVARSGYSSTEKTYIYSIALACADNKNAAALNEMEDVLSGTLVAPTKAAYDKAPVGGYGAFKDFICQAEEFGQSSGTVDFLWVIDNTGSMEDELENVVKTAQTFAQQLDNSGIDYRLAVTTTDAYLLDEASTASPSSYKSGYETIGANDYPIKAYMNMLGIRTATTAIASNYGGFYGAAGLKGEKSTFVSNVRDDSSCTANKNKNVCGKGY